MTWARLDDGFHSHPKVRELLQRDPGAVALQALGLSYAAHYETDGHVPAWFVESVFAEESQRQSALDALTETRMWTRNGSGYEIHDYLDYNLSRSQLEEQRNANRERQRRHRERNA